MENLIHIHKTFEKVNYIDKKINNREFEGCIFKNCNFSNSDFSYNTFIDCEFIDCNLSMIKLVNSSLKTVDFKNCKLLGIQFHACDDFLFNVAFDECVLDYSSFANKKMPKTKFANNSMKEVTFIGTNLSNSFFPKFRATMNCDRSALTTSPIMSLFNSGNLATVKSKASLISPISN